MLSITRKLGNLRSRVNEDHAQWLKGGELEKTNNVSTDMFKLIKVGPQKCSPKPQLLYVLAYLMYKITMSLLLFVLLCAFFLAFLLNQMHWEGESFYFKRVQARKFLKASW